MSVCALFDLRIHPDRVDDALVVLRRILRDTRAFDGNLAVSVEQGDDDPARLLVLSRWASAAHHQAYLDWRAGDGAVADLPPLLAGDPTGARLHTVHTVEPGTAD